MLQNLECLLQQHFRLVILFHVEEVESFFELVESQDCLVLTLRHFYIIKKGLEDTPGEDDGNLLSVAK